MILDILLSFPIPSCRFRSFSKIFDSYSIDLKDCLLTNKNKHIAIENWILIGYIGHIILKEKSMGKLKKNNEKSMDTHFARM